MPVSDWDSPYLMNYIDFGGCQSKTTEFNLTANLETLLKFYEQKDPAQYREPLVALVFVSNTTSPEYYEGADEAVQKLKDAGFQLTFILMGPDANKDPLVNYADYFVYWENLNNPEPDDWDTVRLDAYGCDSN